MLRRFKTVNDYNIFNNNETLLPQVSVVDLSKASPYKVKNVLDTNRFFIASNYYLIPN
jgi:hypothetical protein